MSKRKRPDSSAPSPALTEHEKMLYNLIRSKQDMGIWSKVLKPEAKILDNAAMKALKAVISKGLVKEVVNVQFKGRKHCTAAEFEPSSEITGGPWYNQGNLDTEFIDIMKDQCLRLIRRLGVVTVDMVADEIKKSKILKADYPVQQIGEIVKALALDNDVVEVKSTSIGEFASIQVNKVCYKCITLPDASREPKVGVMASPRFRCEVCPHLRECTPDALPIGFLERVGNRGVVIEKCAPQGRILAHPRGGGAVVSHCGWGSVTESMTFGVPIIAVPMDLDQPLNTTLVKEAVVEKDVQRGEGGHLDGNEIKRAVRHVMVDENRKRVREKTRQLGEIIRNRGDAEVDGLVLQLN